jgi:hypothetical protein
MATALEQFTTRATRILNEYFTPHKYSNFANANLLAGLFPLDSFMPSDGMFVAEAKIQIAKGAIRETSDWTEAFREFHAVTQGAYSLDCNLPILEKALQGRKPSPELLVQLASENAAQLVMTADASAQAAQDQRHEQLWAKYAPKLLEGPIDGMNKWAVDMENKRRQAIADDMWSWPIERLEELDRKKKLMEMPKEELRKIVNAQEPERVQRAIGDRHQGAEPQAILDMRTRAANDVRIGKYRPLPSEFRIPGKDITVPWSHSLLAQLPPNITRQLIQFYGSDALTAACETQKLRMLQKQQGQ